MGNNNKKMPPKEPWSSRGIVEKLAQELGKKVVISPPADLHPLLIDHIVQKIMDFLNVKDLKSARLVSKLWRVEGGRQILSKSHLCPKFNSILKELTEEELLNFLSLVKPSESLKLYCQNEDIFNIIEKFPELAERVKELKYAHGTQHEYVDGGLILGWALTRLPCLEILDTDSLFFGGLQRFDGWNQICLDKLESLKEIRLDFPFSPNNRFLMEDGSRLNNVSKIRLANPNQETQIFLVSDQIEWPLNHITFEFVVNPQDVNQGTIRQFFIKNSNTLKFLDIEMISFNCVGNLTAQKPWKDDWLIPVDFPVLETMIISGSDENIWSLLTIALQLPQLKKLVLARVPDFVSTKIQEWEKNVLANGKKLESLSIEKVELTCQVKYSSCMVLKGRLWPNLKYLKLNLDYKWSFASVIFSPSLFSCWDGLERLELNFRLNTLPEFTSYQEWLMGGVEFPGNYEKGSVIVNESDLYSSPANKLVDLKNLKSLTIYPKSFLLGDFLVYNCLQFMTNLQSLRFGGQSVISDEALNVLKNKLGDIVSFLDKE